MDGLRFNAPCTAIISGPTRSGKTTFTLNLLSYLDNSPNISLETKDKNLDVTVVTPTQQAVEQA